jgi:hypothetical protein
MTDEIWQPIDTAPRDGTEFLAYWPDPIWMKNNAWNIERTWWEEYGGRSGWASPNQTVAADSDEAPTNWLPMSVLPDVPFREVKK